MGYSGEHVSVGIHGAGEVPKRFDGSSSVRRTQAGFGLGVPGRQLLPPHSVLGNE
jgi:hypothetical protein